MKGYKVTQDGLVVVDMPSDVAPHQVKIKVNRTTISRNDILAYINKSNSPILGRQCTGMIVEVGQDVTNFVRGDRVVLDPYKVCGICRNCRDDKPSLCENFMIMGKDCDGYLRDFVVTDTSLIYKLPNNVVDNEAVFVEQVAIALNTIAKLDIKKGEHVVIVGGSITGVVLSQLVQYYQAVPILVDSDEHTLKLARRLGIVYTINQVEVDSKKKILAITGGRMSEKLVLIASSGVSIGRCLSFIMRGGSIAIVDSGGEYDEKLDTISSTAHIALKQAQIIGVTNGCKNIKTAINMLANKAVNVLPFVSVEIEFEDLPKYMEEMIQSPYKYVKVIVKF